jgi:carboxylesterase
VLRARWPDWLASVEDGYHVLRGACDRIVPIGLSMGGLLALVLSSRFDVAGVVPMSVPFHPPDRRMRGARGRIDTDPVRRYTAGMPDWRALQAMATHLEYPQYPIRGGLEVYDLIGEMRASLPRINCPVLIIHSRNDHSVPFEDAGHLQSHLGSPDTRIVSLENSGHVVKRDAERGRVFDEVSSFVRRLTPSSA